MSQPAPPGPRPFRVTFASVMGVAGCLILVLSLFDTLARVSGTGSRGEIADMLADPPFQGSGIEVDTVVAVLRGLGYAAGAFAAAGVVLAVFVALRHHGARIGFTVVAVLLLFTMPTTGLLPVIPAVAASMMWRRDARDWFAGRAPEPRDDRARRDDRSADRPADRPAWPPVHDPDATQARPEAQAPTASGASQAAPWQQPYASGPRADQPAGADPWTQHPQQPQPETQLSAGQPYAQPPYAQQPWQQQPWTGSGPGQPTDRRPGTVTAAAVLSLIGAGLGLLAGGSVLIALAVARGAVEDAIMDDRQVDRLAMSMDEVVALMWGTGAVITLWSIVALVLAVLVLRRSTVARVLLAMSAGVAALVSLVAILSGVAAVTLLLGIATVVLLFSGGANDWFAGRPRGSGGGGGGGRGPVSGSGPPW